MVKLLKQKKRFDLWLLLFPIFFCLFGILMIFEASNVVAFRDFGDKYSFVKDQFTWFLVGIVALTVTSFIPYKKYYSLAIPFLGISILTLIAVFIPGIGIHTQGANRWIGVSSFNFQPSEPAKLALIIYLSSWLSAREKGRLFAFLLLFGLIVGLVILQPDLGTAIILSSIFIVMYFISGVSLWHFIILIPIVIAGTILATIKSPYRFARLMTFLNPNFDPLGASYHIRQILISFGSGGLFGLGLGASRQKYQFLPEATTDSIFAIIGEEFGFIGTLFFTIFYLLFLYRIYLVVKHAPDKQSFLLGGGILTLLGFQTLINLGSMVALVPLTGVPLPFISYGGSHLVITLIAVGIIINISKHTVF